VTVHTKLPTYKFISEGIRIAVDVATSGNATSIPHCTTLIIPEVVKSVVIIQAFVDAHFPKLCIVARFRSVVFINADCPRVVATSADTASVGNVLIDKERPQPISLLLVVKLRKPFNQCTVMGVVVPFDLPVTHVNTRTDVSFFCIRNG